MKPHNLLLVAILTATWATTMFAEAPTTAPTGIRRVHVLVSGHVQGVGFRAFTADNAQRLKLTGWVSNLSDGRVEVIVEGPAEQIDKLLKIVAVGPGRVDNMETTDERPSPGEFERFEVRP